MSKIKLYIHTKDGKNFEADNIDEVYFTSKNVGDIGLLSGCDPFICLVDVSHMFYKIKDQKIELATSGGMVDFNKNICSMFLDTFEFKSEIDEKRALSEKENALKIIEDNTINDEKIKKIAHFSLKKAINRINLLK